MFSLLSLTLALSLARLAASTPGCGKDVNYKTGQQQEAWVESDGHNRTFLIYIPDDFSNNVSVPLILSYHGNNENAEGQAARSDFHNPNYDFGGIVVYPQGLGDNWSNAPYYENNDVDDLNFTSAILQNLTTDFCIDQSRVYCSGKSVGAGMCTSLACHPQHSAHFAAIAPVAGAFYTTPVNKTLAESCNPAHMPFPYLEFHGLKDTIMPYPGGVRHNAVVPDIGNWTEAWAIMNGDSKQAKPTAMNTSSEGFSHMNYTVSGSPGVVQHYIIYEHGHIWPSTGYNPDNHGYGAPVDATPLIIEFFSQFRLKDSEISKVERREHQF